MASVLIVEDEEKLARMLELELNYEGYKTEKAFDGRTGLELALSGKYDLILLDIMLPQLSGMEVLRRLRREGQHYTPVLLLTARDSVTSPDWTQGRRTISQSPLPSRSCWPASG